MKQRKEKSGNHMFPILLLHDLIMVSHLLWQDPLIFGQLWTLVTHSIDEVLLKYLRLAIMGNITASTHIYIVIIEDLKKD